MTSIAAPLRGSTRTLMIKCIALLGIAALPIIFNALVDPSRLLGSRAEVRSIADALLAGHNVGNARNYNDRAIARLLAKRRTGRPDVLALGSSRIQILRGSGMPGLTFENAGVVSGRLDDFIGMYDLYDTPARRPHRVLINLDPQTLDTDLPNALWISLARERAALLERMGVQNSFVHDAGGLVLGAIERLASPEYFRLAVFSLRTYGLRGVRYAVLDGITTDDRMQTPEGSFAWAASSDEQRERSIQQYLRDFKSTEYMLANVDVREQHDRERLLATFLAYMRKEGVDVTVVLVPFHPTVYQALSVGPYHWLDSAERRYREVARQAGVAIIGSYDPGATGTIADDLFDESHMKPDALARLVRPAITR